MSLTVAERAELIELIGGIYTRHAVGCCLHITVDDPNYKDADVRCCLETAVDRQHPDCERAAHLLLKMRPTARRKLASARPWDQQKGLA